jgi:M3 family oligoendopeptidase
MHIRADIENIKSNLTQMTERLKGASTFEQAEDAFLRIDEEQRHFVTAANIVYIRNQIDTRDKFYDEEQKFFDEVSPVLEEYMHNFSLALLKSPIRPQFEEKYGKLMFVNTEIELKTFSPEIIPDMQQENALVTEYTKLLASAQIPFEGQVYTLSQLSPFKQDPDDERRYRAWKAEADFYAENGQSLDRIYDELVSLRDSMAKKLGYSNYIELGYYRMTRNSYTKEDIEKFRAAVRRYLVPVADGIYRRQAERLGKTYPMNFPDNALEFRSGNPKPKGSPDDILAHGKVFYSELSSETRGVYRFHV